MKLKGAAMVILAGMLCTQPLWGNAAEVNQDPVNTEVTDETLYVGFQAEPSTLWGAAGAKLENEDVLVSRMLFDMLDRSGRQTRSTRRLQNWSLSRIHRRQRRRCRRLRK